MYLCGEMSRLELNILGCGSATTTLRHLPTCQVLNVRDHLMMIDCGEGAQLSMRKQRLKFSRLRHIFISHLHGDHCFGLPGLLSTMALMQCSGTVTVHIHRDGAELFRQMMDYFCRERPFELVFHEIGTQPECIYEDHAVRVTTLPLRHRVPTVGFRFDEKPKLRHIRPDALQTYDIPYHAVNRLRCGEDFVAADGRVIANDLLTTPPEPSVSYAYCSDTTPSDRLVAALEGVDWLYHESTYGDGCEKMARNRYHSTAREAATVASRAGVKKLIIGHYSSRYADEQDLLRQAQEVFPDTILAQEGLMVDLMKI